MSESVRVVRVGHSLHAVEDLDKARRLYLAVFGAWKPPDGFEFKGFYAFADGTGGFAIVEADSAATVARGTAPFTPWLRFKIVPIVEIEESVGIGQEAIAFRDSVS